MAKSRTKQSHYIPKLSYLSFFTDKDDPKSRLWVYMDKKNLIKDIQEEKEKRITPQNFCKEQYYYETPSLPLNTIEKLLASLEGDYKKILDTKILNKKKLTEKDKEIITAFISTLEMRVPVSKNNIHGFLDKALKQVNSLEEQFMEGKKSKLHEDLIELKEDNMAFGQSVLMSLALNRWRFSDLLFMFVQFDGDDQFFITSDFPTSLVDFTMMNSIYGIPPNSQTAEMTVPLTPKVSVFVNNLGVNGYVDINPNFVREVNYRSLINEGSYIISPQKLENKFILNWMNRFPQSFVLRTIRDKLIKGGKKKFAKRPAKPAENQTKK